MSVRRKPATSSFLDQTQACDSSGALQDDVRRLFARSDLDGLKAELRQVDAREESFSFAKQDGREREMHFIDQARHQVLTNRRYAAADPHVLAFGRVFGSLQRGLGS